MVDMLVDLDRQVDDPLVGIITCLLLMDTVLVITNNICYKLK